jgi:uncharacterized YigZ family protein
MVETYKTVEKNVSVNFEERKSRFIAHVRPVKTEEEAVDFISHIKSEFWDATHNVYAWCVGEGGCMASRYSDDGEPQGTAGLPVLEVIRKNSLRDVCIVVTRYFGGILLGAPGLVRAYGKSASLGVAAAGITEMIPCDIADLIVEYNIFDRVQYVLGQKGYIIQDVNYGQDVRIKLLVPEGGFNEFSDLIVDMTNNACLVDKSGKTYFSRSLQNNS